MTNEHNLSVYSEDSGAAKGGFVVAICFCVLCCIILSAAVLTSAGESAKIDLQIQSRINPNTAPPASLVRLPGIGRGRAAAIIAYRNNFRRQDSHSVAFRSVKNLENVKTIGPKTAEKISKWLIFD